MEKFAEWLARTQISQSIQSHLWVVPTVQSVHIVAIGVVMASVFMVDLRIFGWVGRDQSLAQVSRRFGPWLWGALSVLFVTGVLMITGEPVRELMSLSFWIKMSLLAIGATLALVFQRTLRRHRWEETHANSGATKLLAIVTLLVWWGIIVMGRLIAYDHVWGSWSLKPLT